MNYQWYPGHMTKAMRMMQGQFTLDDLLAQLQQMDKLGDVKGIMKMIPGVARFAKQIDESKVDNKMLRRQQAIIQSMTPEERNDPSIMRSSHKRRIAAVHGRDEPFYVKELTLREYDELSVTESFVDSYTDMWKTFFEAITIKQRKNPKCQNNLFPIWLRKHATEFN